MRQHQRGTEQTKLHPVLGKRALSLHTRIRRQWGKMWFWYTAAKVAIRS